MHENGSKPDIDILNLEQIPTRKIQAPSILIDNSTFHNNSRSSSDYNPPKAPLTKSSNRKEFFSPTETLRFRRPECNVYNLF